MLLVSGPELVIAACRAGVVGAFPTANARTISELAEWLERIDGELSHAICPHTGQRAAPVAANLIVHGTNDRLHDDLRALLAQPPEIVITSVGSPADVIGPLHEVGTLVFSDVASIRHAHRAIEAGADGLILLSAGAGGQTGWANPLAFVRAVRRFFDGPLILAGGISDGVALQAAIRLGADLAYMGTRFLATVESMAPPGHKQMLVTCSMDDIVLTSAFTGLPTSMLGPSITAVGIDLDKLKASDADMAAALSQADGASPKRWRDLWSAGHPTSGILDIPTVAALVERTIEEYRSTPGPRPRSAPVTTATTADRR
jgi:nitronate monooxygenase